MKKCLFCGNLYTKKTSSLKEWSKQKYCSRECSNKSKIGKPNKSNAKFIKGDKRLVGNTYGFIKGFTPWNKGRTWTKEERQKISNTMKGKSQPWHSGDKCNFWKGGKSSEYTKLKNSLEWKEWRRKVFERDDYTCQECGSRCYKGNGKSVWIHPHHIKSRTEFSELQFEVSNGQTLCRDCHRKTYNYGIKAVRRKGSTGATS